MLFTIFILVLLAAIGFFHYVQGFFSSTISAIISIISAVVAVSYYETIVEGPLAGVAPDWMPALIVMGLFAVTFILLRTAFDKMVPGQIQVPAVVDKVGGAAMGLVAGIFALGVVAIAAQLMPLRASLGGYVRYETSGTRNATLPGAAGGRGAAKDVATFDEIVGTTFMPENARGMLVPVDDIVVSTVARLSQDGALQNGRPLTRIHPNLLQELFGQRLGIETTASHTAVNNPGKNLAAVEVVGVYEAPLLDASRIVDHEFKMVRGKALTLSPNVPADEIRIVVRVKFDKSAADTKDGRIRVSPGAVRLVTSRPDESAGEALVPHNYYPIGTLDARGILYLNKVDDYLFIESNAKKADGSGEGPAEADFVYQVKRDGFIAPGDRNVRSIAAGTFLEVKRFGRVDLTEGPISQVKPFGKPVPVLAVRRKQLDREGGPKPPEPGKVGAVPAPLAAASAEPAPVTAGGGGGALGDRLVGEWKTGGGITASETLTFTADGQMTSAVGSSAPTPFRWVAAGPPQGETLTIKTAPAGADPAGGEPRTIAFEGDDQFTLTDSSGNRRFTRIGSAVAGTPEAAPDPDPAMSRMVGQWADAEGLTYAFRIDGSYTASKGEKIATGEWRVTSVEDGGQIINIELVPPSGNAVTQKWKVGADGGKQMIRVVGDKELVYQRTS